MATRLVFGSSEEWVLDPVPPNHSGVLKLLGGGAPSFDFGNGYVRARPIVTDPSTLQVNNRTTLTAEAAAGTESGLEIRKAANVIGRVGRKLTQGAPLKACGASPIAGAPLSLASPVRPRAGAPATVVSRVAWVSIGVVAKGPGSGVWRG